MTILGIHSARRIYHLPRTKEHTGPRGVRCALTKLTVYQEASKKQQRTMCARNGAKNKTWDLS